jgi:hypothetical protein
MALTDDNGVNATMLMQPAYGTPYGGGYGGGGLFGGNNDLLGLLFVIALCNGGFGGFGFGGGYGAMLGMGGMWGMDMLYPWLNNSQNINDGFRSQQLATQVNGIQNAITSGFGDVQLGIAGVNQNICQTGNGITNAVNQGFASTNLGIANSTAAVQNSLCNGFNGVNNSIFGAQTAISQQMNANEMASLNRSFAEQAANSQGFNGVQAQLAQNGYNQAAGLADVKFTLATEACNTRTTDTANTQAVLNAINNGIQSIKDDLCADRLAASQRETEAERRENANLRSQLNMTQLAASQAAQNTFISQGFANEVDALYNRLKSCPVNTVPVYGNQPIFTCSQNVANSNFGCGCNGNNF